MQYEKLNNTGTTLCAIIIKSDKVIKTKEM